MKLVALVLGFLASCARGRTLLPEDEYQSLFKEWALQYSKEYDAGEMFVRYGIFKENVNTIRAHNEMNHSYTLGLNEFADLTWDEFKANRKGLVMPSERKLRSVEMATFDDTVEVPGEIDWVAKGAVTPVKNQERCGSCWAFSATGAMEGAWFVKTGKLVSLSEQQLISCSHEEGNNGCEGGLMDDAFEYVIDNGGLSYESEYEYDAMDEECKSEIESSKKEIHISTYHDLPQGDENALKKAVARGPVSIAIEADQMDFQFYSGGVFDAECGDNLDHGVLIVGYGTDKKSGKTFFKVKNSWGGSWGEEGYIRLAYGKNMCGLADMASFPVV